MLAILPGSSSYAVTLAWDASDNADGYIVYWGPAPGEYNYSQDVGDVLLHIGPIATESYIAVTAYNEEGESGYSNEVYFEDPPAEEIQPATGGQIYTVDLTPPVTGTLKLGVDYDFQELPNGDIIIIYRNLDPGDRVRLEY